MSSGYLKRYLDSILWALGISRYENYFGYDGCEHIAEDVLIEKIETKILSYIELCITPLDALDGTIDFTITDRVIEFILGSFNLVELVKYYFPKNFDNKIFYKVKRIEFRNEDEIEEGEIADEIKYYESLPGFDKYIFILENELQKYIDSTYINNLIEEFSKSKKGGNKEIFPDEWDNKCRKGGSNRYISISKKYFLLRNGKVSVYDHFKNIIQKRIKNGKLLPDQPGQVISDMKIDNEIRIEISKRLSNKSPLRN